MFSPPTSPGSPPRRRLPFSERCFFAWQGLRSALSAKVLENAIHIVDVSTMTTHKTAAIVSWLAEKDLDSALFVDGEQVNETLELAIGNIPRVALLPQLGANVYETYLESVRLPFQM